MTTQTTVSGQVDQIEKIKLSKIRRDGGTQSRAQLDEATVERYVEALSLGDTFPPIELTYDGTDYWPWDGFHRLAATERFGAAEEIDAHIRQGTRRDAILLAAGANAKHGLLRSEADKRRAIQTLLADDEWSLWSDRKIATATNTYHGLVGKIRKEMFPDAVPEERVVERGGTQYTMRTGAINDDRTYSPTDEDKQRIKAALAEGELHRSVLETRSMLSSRAFAATLQLLQDSGEIIRNGLIYRLRDLPETTPVSRDADKLYQWLVEQGGFVNTADATAACRLTTDEFIRAANLLGAMQRMERKLIEGKVMIKAISAADNEPHGEDSAPALPEDDEHLADELRHLQQRREARIADDPTPEESDSPPAPATERAIEELQANFDRDAITLDGRTDDGAWHRAIEIARRLVAVGVWDGQAKIEFDAYRVHDLLFGVNPIPLTGPDDRFGETGIYFPEVYQLTGQAHIEWIKRQRHQSVDSIINSACTWGKEDLEALLDAEREHANRASLVKWLTGRLENALPEEMLSDLDWADRRAINDLPATQREMLVAVYREQPVVKNAATRIALINRGLLANGGEDWWSDIQMTDKGRRLAALLHDVMPSAVDPLRDLILSVLSTGAASVKTIGRAAAARTGRNITEGALSTVINDLLIEGAVIMLDSDTDGAPLYALAGAAIEDALAPREPDTYQRRPISLDLAKSLIHDALRGSQRPLGRGELRKYAGIDAEDRDVAEQAIDVLLEKGVIAEVNEPGQGRRYHYVDLLPKMIGVSAVSDRAADQLETVLINAASAIDLALKAAAPDWSQVDPARQDELRDLLRQTSEAAARLIERIEVTWWPPEGTSDAA